MGRTRKREGPGRGGEGPPKVCPRCGQPYNFIERKRVGGRVYLLAVHMEAGRRVRHYLGPEGEYILGRVGHEFLGDAWLELTGPGPDPGRELERRIAYLRQAARAVAEMARATADLERAEEALEEVLEELRVRREATGRGEGMRGTGGATPAGTGTGELEDLPRKWEGELASARLSELLRLGRVVDDLGIRGLAARWGMDLPRYVMYASNFYDFWHDRVMKLIDLGVLNMDGEINYDLICGRARARCGGGNSCPPPGTWGAGLNCLFVLARERGATRFQSQLSRVRSYCFLLSAGSRYLPRLRAAPTMRPARIAGSLGAGHSGHLPSSSLTAATSRGHFTCL